MRHEIEVRQMVKTFGKKTALSGVNFHVRRGEIFGFLGPSGSGKTTMVKILTSQLLHTAGSVQVFGTDVSKLRDPSQLKRIGILTDNSGLYDRLTVYENLELFCRLYDVDVKRIDEVLEEVNLIQDKKTAVRKLSKGMKQRVTLVRALLHKPELLFLDEPTSALDPTNKKQIHESLRKLNESGTTIFLSTHDMQEAESLCQRLAFLDHGKIVELDNPHNLRVKYGDSTISLVLRNGSRIQIKQDEAGAQTVAQYIAKGELMSIHSNEPTLGEIFIQLTGRSLQ
ncbi:bacitracin ABC transporter ATP-binding protein [Cohnella sp. CIP 111063]|jgi:ABC-type multidrug transport system, ATPase component|uniref:ABC transporter ATP-binding protein n=1 Tax=unclassified Cohnella TaxID=2636738 RepID=UPI000B8C22D9|nr:MULTISPECIES: ABC transporter ATP-binding protein [unclassified Cohnella]OXS56958.1 bacitracin ABC transporter ATP-binding protein [Cohnella sp. CIP 111063]PRX69806.1 ABC-2 type transport system ATP-binding protein [Cohnella sp. SGD-V74]